MSLLATMSDVLKNVGNFLLPGEPFKLSTQPISNVSVKPIEIGTTATKTLSTYLANPTALKSDPLLLVPVDYYLSTSAKASGAQGNIWDIIGQGAQKVINTGFNVLTQKMSNVSAETSYNPVSSAVNTNPFVNYTNGISDILGKAFNPAIQAGIKEGIQTTVSPPTWIWFALGGLVLFFIARRK